MTRTTSWHIAPVTVSGGAVLVESGQVSQVVRQLAGDGLGENETGIAGDPLAGIIAAPPHPYLDRSAAPLVEANRQTVAIGPLGVVLGGPTVLEQVFQVLHEVSDGHADG